MILSCFKSKDVRIISQLGCSWGLSNFITVVIMRVIGFSVEGLGLRTGAVQSIQELLSG